ncbi:MAG: O-antigen ligase family protein [bacterium]|nr:O-antigen ligase family protein [bacterium]
MRNILKNLNIHDYLIMLLLLIPFFPLSPIPFSIGHIYCHEIIVLSYSLGNLLLFLFNKEERKSIVRFNDIQKTGLMLLIFVLINFLFSFQLLKGMDQANFIKSIKVHINVLRGYGAFFMVFILFSHNVRKSTLKTKGIITLLFTVFCINLLFFFILLLPHVELKKLILNTQYYLEFRNKSIDYKYNFPDGAYALFIMAFSHYLFCCYQKTYQRILLGFGFILSIITIFATFSRIFLPGFFLLILFFLIFLYPGKVKLVFLGLGAFFLSLGGFRIIWERLVHYRFNITGIGSGRFVLVSSIFNIFADNINNLLYGIGTGNYFYYTHSYVLNPIFVGYSTPHNQFLTVLTDTGLLGYFLFLFFLLSLIRQAWKNARSVLLPEMKTFYLGLMGLFLTFCSMSLFAEMIVSYHPPMNHYLVYLWMVLSLCSVPGDVSCHEA